MVIWHPYYLENIETETPITLWWDVYYWWVKVHIGPIDFTEEIISSQMRMFEITVQSYIPFHQQCKQCSFACTFLLGYLVHFCKHICLRYSLNITESIGKFAFVGGLDSIFLKLKYVPHGTPNTFQSQGTAIMISSIVLKAVLHWHCPFHCPFGNTLLHGFLGVTS